MKTDFSLSDLSPVYHYPWSTQVRLCFYVHGERLQIKKDTDNEFNRCPDSFIVGPQLVGVHLNFGKGCLCVAVSFQPGGFQRLLGIPTYEIVSQEIEARFLFGKEIGEIEMRLQEAADFPSIVKIIENYFLKKLYLVEEMLPFDFAINELVKYNGNLPIENIASLACLSIRQFERKCNEKIGMSPKLFARLIRFSKAYILKETQSKVSWTSIAHECGYHDQMHLIKDFKSFAGSVPSAINKSLPSSLKLVALLEPDA